MVWVDRKIFKLRVISWIKIYLDRNVKIKRNGLQWLFVGLRGLRNIYWRKNKKQKSDGILFSFFFFIF